MSLEYICKGKGKPLLFLHGYLSNKESFLNQIEFFSKYFMVYAVDLSGFGKNPPLDKAYSLNDYVLDLLNFIKQKNINNFNIIAHSFGARLVLKSDKLRAMADKIVLTGGAGLKPKRGLKYYYKVYKYKLLKRILPNSEKLKNYGSNEYKNLSSIMQSSYKKIVNEHLDYTLKDIKNKTLIINGKQDKTTPKYMAKKLNKKIFGSQLVFIEGAGHFAFIDKPTIFNVIVKEFLLF